MGHEALPSSFLNYPFKTVSSPSSLGCSSTLGPVCAELPNPWSTQAGAQAPAGRGWRRGRAHTGQGEGPGAAGSWGRVPTRRPAPSWSRGRHSRASAASSPPLPPCRRSWRRPPRTWRAVPGVLSPRGEPAGGARESAAGSGEAHRPFPARRLPGARPPPPPPRLFLPALPLRGGAKVTISRDTQCYTGQKGKEGAGEKMAPSGESGGHAPQAARAARDALGSDSAESCGQPPKPPFFLLSQWGKQDQFLMGVATRIQLITITGNIHVAVSWQRPRRAGPWHCCKRMCPDA